MIKYIMYKDIQKYKKNGLTKAEIRRQTGKSEKTVRKYYSMTAEEYAEYVKETSNRDKLYNPYKQEILKVYEANGYQVLIKSAVYDYLEELYGELPGTERTLSNYIEHLIETEDLTISKSQRSYTPVDQLPFGKQLQIDFGVVKTLCNRKLHIFAAVLSASRYKFCAVQDHPFNTEEVIQHLLDCFLFIGGIPEELVIDQDRTMVIKENYGDIIYTEKFKDFINEMNLNMYVCRKSDPETKGKIENMIKFVKQNFFSIRRFESFEDVVERLHNWLIRRANGKISTATRRIPSEMIKLERDCLRPMKSSIHQRDDSIVRENRKVNSSGFILVKTSRYELPDNYRDKNVDIFCSDHELFIYDKKTGNIIIEHCLSLLPGKVIRSRKSIANTLKRKQELMEELKGWVSGECWFEFIESCFSKYSRYFRDQYNFALKYLKESADNPVLPDALHYCLENKTFSMSCLYDTYSHLVRESEIRTEKKQICTDQAVFKKQKTYPDVNVAKTDISIYKNLFQGAVS